MTVKHISLWLKLTKVYKKWRKWQKLQNNGSRNKLNKNEVYDLDRKIFFTIQIFKDNYRGKKNSINIKK